jgi:hypothetical protein
MFRFTIRDVLWLTVLAGIACGRSMEVARRFEMVWAKASK